MAISFTGKKRIRKSFGRVPEVAPMPNLIEVQKSSYDHFLQMGVTPEQRANVGLQEVLKSVFPIRDFSERAQLEFVRYELETPKYDVDECQQRGITFAAPLKVTLRLVVWDVDEDTGARSIRDIKEQDVYMGDMPLMTKNGTFIINGTERVIVSQMHRSPGRVLRPRQGQDPFLGQVSVRRAGHSLSRLVARFRVRRQGPPLRAHRPAPQAAGDDLADGARRRCHAGAARRSARPRRSRCSPAKPSACPRKRSCPGSTGRSSSATARRAGWRRSTPITSRASSSTICATHAPARSCFRRASG